MNNKAFTLIELLVVVALLGILSSIAVVSFQGHIESTKRKAAELNLSTIHLAQQEYKSNNGSYYILAGCSSTSDSKIDTDLFDGIKKLSGDDDDPFQYCILNTNGFTAKAVNPDTGCEITLEEDFTKERDNCN